VFLQLEEFLSHFCDVVGGAADAGIKGPVVDNFYMEGVIFFKVDSMVNQLEEGLVRVEHKLLFAGQHSMGVGVSVGMEGIGVDSAIASACEEKFRGLHVEVVLIERGDNLSLTIED